MPDEEDAFGVGHAQFVADEIAREDAAVAIDFRVDAPSPTTNSLQPACTQVASAFPSVIKGKDHHAGPDFTSAPCTTGRAQANVDITAITETAMVSGKMPDIEEQHSNR